MRTFSLPFDHGQQLCLWLTFPSVAINMIEESKDFSFAVKHIQKSIPIMMTQRPRSSEKLIPSLIFPPTTQNKRAPAKQQTYQIVIHTNLTKSI